MNGEVINNTTQAASDALERCEFLFNVALLKGER